MTTTPARSRRRRALVGALLCACIVSLGPPVRAAQKHFPSADDAGRALADSLRSGDTKAILEVLGPDGERLIASGDPVEDAEARERFVKNYDEAHSLVNTSDTVATLQVGSSNWPLPIPLVKEDAGWRFDTDAGDEELLNRRIGRNEIAAIQAALAYVDAQREYYHRNPEGTPLLHYASRISSTKGKRDGLYWGTAEDEAPSPLGELFATAHAEGYKTGKGDPYHGYYYRVLTAQGPDARGGAYDYVAKGKMIGGFGLIAYPAGYASSGVMTFVVNHDGTVFQKDLGPKTATLAPAIKTFNPDATWTRVEEPEDD